MLDLKSLKNLKISFKINCAEKMWELHVLIPNFHFIFMTCFPYYSEFCDDQVEEFFPFVVEESKYVFFLLVWDACIGQWVQGKFLEIGDVEVPRQETIKIVQSYAFVAHEARVVWIDRHWQSLMKEATRWMVAHVQHITEDKITHGTTLKAYLFSFDHLDEARMVRQVEAVADSLGAEKHCIVELLIATRVALASM